jgi:hypothetical protein
MFEVHFSKYKLPQRCAFLMKHSSGTGKSTSEYTVKVVVNNFYSLLTGIASRELRHKLN